MMLSNMVANLSKRYPLQTINVSSPDGTQLPVSVIGNGQPVMMLHAFGMDARQFLPFILPLTKQYRFYLPHFRGFGLATELILTKPNFIDQYVEDTEQVLQYITAYHDTDAIPVTGFSMGALTMWAYFKRFGTHRISRYLNIDQAPIIHNQADWQGGLFGRRQDELFAKFESQISKTKLYTAINDFRHLPYSIKVGLLEMERSFSLLSVDRKQSQLLVMSSNHRTPHQIALLKHATWQHKLRCLDAYIQSPFDYRDVLATVDIPTTLIIGGRSQLYNPEWQQRLITMLPNATMQILPKSGHAVPIDAPFEFYRILKRFLESQ